MWAVTVRSRDGQEIPPAPNGGAYAGWWAIRCPGNRCHRQYKNAISFEKAPNAKAFKDHLQQITGYKYRNASSGTCPHCRGGEDERWQLPNPNVPWPPADGSASAITVTNWQCVGGECHVRDSSSLPSVLIRLTSPAATPGAPASSSQLYVTDPVSAVATPSRPTHPDWRYGYGDEHIGFTFPSQDGYTISPETLQHHWQRYWYEDDEERFWWWSCNAAEQYWFIEVPVPPDEPEALSHDAEIETQE